MTADRGTPIVPSPPRAGEDGHREEFGRHAEGPASSDLVISPRYVDALFEYSVTPLVLLNRDFDFLRVNEAYAQSTGRKVEDFLGHNHFELFPSDAQTIFEEVLRSKRPFNVRARPFEFADHPEWGMSYWDWNLAPVLDDRGEVEALVFSLRDVTSEVEHEKGRRGTPRGKRRVVWPSLDFAVEKRRASIVVPIGVVLEVLLFYGLSMFDSPSHYLGIPGPAATLIGIGVALVAGPVAGGAVALVGGVAYFVFMTDFGASVAWVAIVIAIILWTVSSVVAALVADRVRERAAVRETLLDQAIKDRDTLNQSLRESEQRQRLLAEENERLYRQQLDIAEKLQLALLNIPSAIGRVRLGHLYRSATETARVGGDFYDVFEVKDGNIAVLIGDVSGHGIEAARTATLVKDVVHAFAHQSLRTNEVLRRTNRLLVEKEMTGFVTVFLGILESDTGEFRYSSAGHPETLLRRASGAIEKLGSGSFPLGVFADATWRPEEVRLQADDVLLLYTDGVIEARGNDESFGQERLGRLLRRHWNSIERLPYVVIDKVLAFAEGRLTDDAAVLAVALTEEPSWLPSEKPFSQQTLLD